MSIFELQWALGVKKYIKESFFKRFTFTPIGKREFVPRDLVFPLIVVYCLLLLLKNK